MSTRGERLFLTGASGLLGRAVYKKFRNEGWNVYGTAFSRVGEEFRKVDLGDRVLIEKTLKDFKPHFVIHCAAQRHPDKVESQPDAAVKLNVGVTKHLADISAEISAPFLYISTDYVFDGTSPPYTIEDAPNPLNLYGKTKLEGEYATMGAKADHIVLRIPVLYGPVERLAESAVTVLFDTLITNEVPAKVSNYEKRCPSHVDDIAEICYELATKKLKGEKISGIYQWCGSDVLTKYEMIVIMAEVFKLSHDHITPEGQPLSNSTLRPFNTRMDTSCLESLNINPQTLFREGIYKSLKPWTGM